MLITISFVFSILKISSCGRAPTWDSCHCHWEAWKPWSSCTKTCGGGQQVRERRVWSYDKPGCDVFEDCATSDMGWERRACNTNCFNSGTYKTYVFGGYCECLKGFKGTCCEQVVNCGTPSQISHGKVSGTDFRYGRNVQYKCESDYNMTSPAEAIKTCTEHGYWTGTLPTCLYATSCRSNPCQNGATCISNLGGYDCTCHPGWTGTNCEIDIQPPVFDACPKNKSIYTSNMTYTDIWTYPIFKDPFGGDVIVSKNYESSSFTFPWGVHTVTYSGTKPSNGLSTEYIFTITVQPNPCLALQTPANGILVCNMWQTKYSSVCKLLCKTGYTYPPGFSENDWYVCAASGNWFPGTPMTQCVSQELRLVGVSTTKFQCENSTRQEHVSSYYIKSLKASSFNNLCEKHKDECTEENVSVTCF